MSDNKKDLILSLAGAMGISGDMNRVRSRYDSSTGTLYCGSFVYQPSDIIETKDFLKKTMEKLSKNDRVLLAYYDIALSSIELLKRDFLVSNGGKLVVKEDKGA